MAACGPRGSELTGAAERRSRSISACSTTRRTPSASARARVRVLLSERCNDIEPDAALARPDTNHEWRGGTEARARSSQSMSRINSDILASAMVQERDWSLSSPAASVTGRSELPSIVTMSQAYGSPQSVPITENFSIFQALVRCCNGIEDTSVPVAEILDDFVLKRAELLLINAAKPRHLCRMCTGPNLLRGCAQLHATPLVQVTSATQRPITLLIAHASLHAARDQFCVYRNLSASRRRMRNQFVCCLAHVHPLRNTPNKIKYAIGRRAC